MIKELVALFYLGKVTFWHVLGILFLSVIVALFEVLSIGMFPAILAAVLDTNVTDDLKQPIKFVVEISQKYPSEDVVLYSCIMLCILIMCKNALMLIQSYISGYISSSVMGNVRSQLLEKYFLTDYVYLQRKKTGELVDTIASFSEKVSGLVLVVINTLTKIAMLMVGIVIIYMINASILAYMCVFIAIVLVMVTVLGKYISRVSLLNARTSNEFIALMVEEFKAIKYTLSQGIKDSRLEELLNVVDRNAESNKRLVFIQSTIPSLVETMGGVFIAAVLVTSFRMADNYEVVLIQVFPVVILLMRLIPYVQQVNHNRGIIHGRLHHLYALNGLVDDFDKNRATETRTFEDGEKIIVSFKDVSYSYGNKVVFDNISYDLYRGRVVMIVGPSGGGKSTLIGLLTGLYKQQSGVITLYNDMTKNVVSVALQEPCLHRRSIKDNVLFPNRTSHSDLEVINFIKQVDANEFISDMPKKLNTTISDDGSSLSGGQRQRVSLARALSYQPDLLLLDEATSALDPSLEISVVDNIIRNKKHETTIVMVTHNHNLLNYSDEIIYVSNGQATIYRSKDEFLKEHTALDIGFN